MEGGAEHKSGSRVTSFCYFAEMKYPTFIWELLEDKVLYMNEIHFCANPHKNIFFFTLALFLRLYQRENPSRIQQEISLLVA
jgi:hypothetical protein